jgi:hypothetical protein
LRLGRHKRPHEIRNKSAPIGDLIPDLMVAGCVQSETPIISEISNDCKNPTHTIFTVTIFDMLYCIYIYGDIEK